MQIKLFTIPIGHHEPFLEEMNRFMRGHKVIEVVQHMVTNESGASWCFCLKFIGQTINHDDPKGKIDYKSQLTAEEFEIFSKLRNSRKIISEKEGLPAFAIFTDKELAQITKLKEINIKSISELKGIGQNKIEKYVPILLEVIYQKKEEK